MRDGQILKDLNLNDPDAIKKALARDDQRFDGCEMINQTRDWYISLGLFEAYDQSGDPLDPGYVADTGLTVIAADGLPPGGHVVADVQPQIKCYATRVKASCQVALADGSQEHTVNFTDAVVADPKNDYIGEATFTLTESRGGKRGLRLSCSIAPKKRQRAKV